MSSLCYSCRDDGWQVCISVPENVYLNPENATTYFRITVEKDKMGGLPCIRGLRIPVATVVGMVANRMTHEEILKAYPDLQVEDIHEALLFAAEAVREGQIPILHPADGGLSGMERYYDSTA